MFYYFLKVVISALIIVAVSEIAKKSVGLAALLAALPLTSLTAIIWLRLESQPVERIIDLSTQIFWLAIPSLVLFVLFPMLLKQGVSFWLSLGIASAGTAVAYGMLVFWVKRMGWMG